MIGACFRFGHAPASGGRRAVLRKNFQPLHEELADEWRRPGGPGSWRFVEFAQKIGEEPGIHQHQRGELLEPLQRRAHALRPAPILAHDDESAQIELIDE